MICVHQALMRLGAGGDHHVGLTEPDAIGGIATVCSPEAQKRLTVTPGTVFGQPGQQQADACHVHALLGLGHRAAGDDVADLAPGRGWAPARAPSRSTVASMSSGRTWRKACRCAGRPGCASRRRCRRPESVCS
jgi:hypothetical protein